jgi:hypothetical protein
MKALVAILVLILGACLAAARDSLNHKVMVGYQGWFSTTQQGRQWRHWSSDGNKPHAGQLEFDLFPDLSEYTTLYETDLTYSNGTKAKLWSAADFSTVDLHFRWMKQYGIDGAFIQRFVDGLYDPVMIAFKDLVLDNVRRAAEKNNVTFAVMWDISGAPADSMYTTMQNDFNKLAANGVFNSPAYQYHNDRPVLVVWGFGFTDRAGDTAKALDFVRWLRGRPTTPMGGVPFHWRTGDGDCLPGWAEVFQAFEILSPWSVARWNSPANYDPLFSGTVLADLAQIAGKQDYAPVIWPGFSWANLKKNSALFNHIPRLCGQHMKHMVDKLLTTNSLFLYVAMFDEVNEGTAILKAARTARDAPNSAQFLTLSADPCGTMDSDFYLRLVGAISHTLKLRK